MYEAIGNTIHKKNSKLKIPINSYSRNVFESHEGNYKSLLLHKLEYSPVSTLNV